MNVVDGLVVYPKVILKHMMAELPFMATENIMMDAVKAGGDRQELHERIRELSMIAGKHVKEEGRDNDLLDLIAADEMFHLTKEELEKTGAYVEIVRQEPFTIAKDQLDLKVYLLVSRQGMVNQKIQVEEIEL